MKKNMKKQATAVRERINNMTDEEVIKAMEILDRVNRLEYDTVAYEERNVETIAWRRGWNGCLKLVKGE